MKKVRVLSFALVALATLPTSVFAAKYAKQGSQGRSHVAHTRLAPVLMHRAFPPYAGVHVYERPGSANKNSAKSTGNDDKKGSDKANSSGNNGRSSSNARRIR